MKKKKSAPKKAKAKAKAKKAKPALKAKAKTKSKPKSKLKAAKPKKASKGLSVVELFKLKQEREQAAQDPEAWKHRKDLPPQDQPHAEDPNLAANNGKKSGFGGARHH